MNSITGPASEFPTSVSTGIEGPLAYDARLATSPAGPPQPSSSPDAIRFLRAFQRRWPWAIGLGVLGAAIAGTAAWYLVPAAKYTAEAVLLVEPEQPRLIAATKEYRSDSETDRRTQLTLIKSPIVLVKALGEPEVSRLGLIRKQNDPIEWLEQEIKAEFTGKILRIALSGNNPIEVGVLVKAVTAAYLSEVANKEKNERIERNNVLKGHYDRLQARLEARRGRLRTLATEVGSNDKQTLSLQQRLAVTRQGMAEQELLRIQAELKHAMAEFKVLQAKAGRGSLPEGEESAAAAADDDVERAIQDDPVIQSFAQRADELQGSLGHAMRAARDKSDASILTTRRELNKVRERMKKYEHQLRSKLLAAAKADRREGRTPTASPLVALEDQISVLTELERDLKDEATRFTGDTKKLGSQAVEMESIHDEISSAMEMTKLIGNELEILKLELNAPDRIKLLKDAKAPSVLGSSQRIKFTGAAAGGVFGMVVILISFLEFRGRKIDSQDDVILGLGIKVLGTVPAIPRSMNGALAGTNSQRGRLWQHQLVESVNATAIMLAHAASVGSVRVVLVTSAVGGEGKTSLASHLATSLARSGQRTLLIDGDLRRPMVHRLYDHPQAPGLCEVVRDEITAAAAPRPTTVSNLWVIPAGHYDEYTLPMLAQPRARTLFDQLRKQFDFIILDSAPVLPVADTLVLCRHADATLFSILRDVSQFPKVEAAFQRIAALGVPTLGAVVLGIDLPTSYRYGA